MFARKGPAPSTPTPVPATGPSNPLGAEMIFDATVADFEGRVLMASMQRPVLVDFWSPRSTICKQLTPALEQAVREANGRLALAKVDIDKQPQLAQAMRVQSVPTVLAFFQGQPVHGFQGQQTPAQLKTFIQQIVQLAANAAPEAIDIPATLKQAAELLAAGDVAGAQELYAAILLQEEKNIPAHVGIVRTYIAAGALAEAEAFITSMPDDIAKHADFAVARTALDLAGKAPAGDIAALEAKARGNEGDLQARFDYSLALFAGGRKAEAIEEMVAIVKRDRAWDEDKARKQLLDYFAALGPADPDTLAGRRKLSAVLFS